MSHRATVGRWLQSLSPDGSTLGLDEEGGCVLADADGIVLRLEVSDASGRIYLVSHLGAWREGDAALLPTMMKANFLGLETNGAVLAIDERSAQLALCFSEAVAHLDEAGLKTVIERFWDVRKEWGRRLAAAAPSATPETPSEPSESDAFMIRI